MYLKSSYTGEHENMFPNRNTCIPFHYTRVETLCMYFYVYNQAVERGDHVEINISQVNLKLSVCKQKHPITSSFYRRAPFPNVNIFCLHAIPLSFWTRWKCENAWWEIWNEHHPWIFSLLCVCVCVVSCIASILPREHLIYRIVGSWSLELRMYICMLWCVCLWISIWKFIRKCPFCRFAIFSF